MIHHFSNAPFLSRVMPAVVEELPRTIYLFGANLVAATLTVGFYLIANPNQEDTPSRFFGLAALFFFATFAYGSFLRFQLKRKSQGFR